MLRILHVLFRPKRLQLSAQLIPGISFWLSGQEPPKPGTSKIELLLDLLGDLIHLLGDDIHRLGTPEDGLVPLPSLRHDAPTGFDLGLSFNLGLSRFSLPSSSACLPPHLSTSSALLGGLPKPPSLLSPNPRSSLKSPPNPRLSSRSPRSPRSPLGTNFLSAPQFVNLVGTTRLPLRRRSPIPPIVEVTILPETAAKSTILPVTTPTAKPTTPLSTVPTIPTIPTVPARHKLPLRAPVVHLVRATRHHLVVPFTGSTEPSRARHPRTATVDVPCRDHLRSHGTHRPSAARPPPPQARAHGAPSATNSSRIYEAPSADPRSPSCDRQSCDRQSPTTGSRPATSSVSSSSYPSAPHRGTETPCLAPESPQPPSWKGQGR